MQNTETIFACTQCGAQFAKWTGRCLECGAWSTVAQSHVRHDRPRKDTPFPPATVFTMTEVQKKQIKRLPTGMQELDRVFGGGIVPGSLTLLGGEPGIGKSTLALELAEALAYTLYISAEESLDQIALRAARVGLNQHLTQLSHETSLEAICATIEEKKPLLTIIDSIQTIGSLEVSGESGSVSQVRACTMKLLETAKKTGVAIVLIGHVTKDGAVAGPKTLEHLVDTVLYLEGDRYHNLRILRAVKNRFGSTDEIGMFEMEGNGLKEVKNPSSVLLQERGETAIGSIITCLIEGARPMLVEVQALVNKTVFGYPVRKSSGFDINRLHVLIAVLERRARLSLAQYDVHINIVGGIKANEPGVDLAVCLAIASAYKDKALGNDLAAFGEVGLGGEVRSVRALEKRLKECVNLGVTRIIMPKQQKAMSAAQEKIKLIDVKNIEELITHA